MRPKDIASLAAFLQVAELHSFRAAASRLSVTPSALSQTMRQLEERMGVRLLNRTTRSVSLTDAGSRLFDEVRPAFGQICGALEDLNRKRKRPTGMLRIYASPGAASATVSPVWERFLSNYPEVQLELRIDPAPVDIVAIGFDAIISPLDHLATDMIAVRATGPMKMAFVAAPGYLARHGHPQTPEELLSHRCIQYRLAPDQPLFPWSFVHDVRAQRVPIEGRLILNSSELAIRAAVDGVGIVYAMETMVQCYFKTGQLVKVLDEFSPSFDGFFLGYPSNRQISAPLRAFINMIRHTSG
ncbi:LysR family transcriptional regulator [Dyella psychrodurans]|uniref:LysR family transcriptional regulator n=1 Tax=Dyella psychrodurans TaxID=1927960 RepID=A0A370X6V3_9GAMM|nr:LysR family transcriptional regulator [Dyella psychrodurans]RDS84163.1 LysR family transcriptional regulator [Dyella psychrodurans]